jgi:TetR/AcrR family transcriptional regulator, transcriptional repressor for nem operon
MVKTKRSVGPRKREPDITREKILSAAFDEIYRRGFQAASLDTILAQAGVTKGALYHHFPDKSALGHAVVDDVVRGFLLERWLGVLQQQAGDPISALQGMLKHRTVQLTEHEIELGCPLNNLGQEMSPLDARFRRRVSAIFDQWIDGFAAVLERGRSEGSIRRELDPRRVATFLVAAIEGSFGLAKVTQSKSVVRGNLETLADFLGGLRPTPGKTTKVEKRKRSGEEK